MRRTMLIIGASGLVGSALLREFAPAYRTMGTYCSTPGPNLVHLDLRNAEQVRSVMRKFSPDVVCCPAAEPNVELCEIDPIGTRRVNVEGFRNLVECIAKTEARLVYFSTEYVFDGTAGPYSECDACRPLNEYGRQKLECERITAEQLERYIIGRISAVYNWEMRKKNFVVRFIDCLSRGEVFKVPSDQVVTPTYAPNLGRAVRKLVEHCHEGVFHLAGSMPMLRTEFAQLVANVFELDPTLIVPIPTSELGLRAERPRSAGLRTDKAEAVLDFGLATPRDGLDAMRREQNVPAHGGLVQGRLVGS
jgi:dTDP-4-dehydrorhamnose reductase